MFKKQFSFEERLIEANRVLYKYPDRVPIIVEKNINAPSDCPLIYKNKYLVPRDLTFGHLICVIRKRLNISPEKAIFLFINNTIPPSCSYINDIYNVFVSSDKFLYVTYTYENVFG